MQYRNMKEQKIRGNSKIKDKDNTHDVNPNFHRFNSESFLPDHL